MIGTHRSAARILILATLLSARLTVAATVDESIRTAAAQEQRLWVFLAGKSSTVSSHAATSATGARVAMRIERRGTSNDPTLDDPVDSRYRHALETAGLTIKHEICWLNALTGWVHPDDLDGVAALPFVDSLRPVITLRRSPAEDGEPFQRLMRPAPGIADVYDYGNSRPQIALMQVQYLHAAGLTGNGVRIGFMDTGFSLNIRVFECLDLIATRDFINGDDDVGDGEFAQMRHGTQTLSLCGGFHEGELVGTAPGAEYVLAKTEIVDQEIQIEEDNWVAGLLWLDTMGCDIVSSSLGYADWYSDADFDGNTALSTIAADLAASRGVLVVNAAGNAGCSDGDNRLVVPADGDSVLTVGASNFEGERAGFSSCGPTADGRIKPDVIAPGNNVWTALAGNFAYQPGSGTSYATPLVSGLCALLLEQEPEFTPYDLIQRLRLTATLAHKPLPSYGWGLVQAVDAAGLDSNEITPSRVEICEPVSIDISELQIWPNPAESTITIVTPDGSLADGTFQVYAVDGSLVFESEISLGVGRWDALNAHGERVAPGVYFVLVRTPEIEQVVKLALLPRR